MRRQGKRTAVMLLTALVALAMGGPFAAAAPSEPGLRIEPASVEVGLGETFSVEVVIDDVENLAGFQFDFSYDASILEVEEAAQGEFLESTGRTPIPLGPKMNPEEGVVTIGAASFGDAPGADGSGVLAVITCRAQAEGTSALELEGVQVLDPSATPISVNVEGGEVVIPGTEAGSTGGVTPSPSSVAEASDAATSSSSETTADSAESLSGGTSRVAGAIPTGWLLAGLVVAVGAVALVVLVVLSRRSDAV